MDKKMLDSDNKSKNSKIGAVMVVGAGIGGVQSSIDLADSGYKVYLVEKSPAIGGVMAQLDKTFPTNDCSMCIISPKLLDCARNNNIELLTYSEVENVTGEPGNFKVRVKRKARYIDESKCTGCGECTKNCPVIQLNEFDEGLAQRKAIYKPFPQATPNVFTVEKHGTPPCTAACPAGCNAHGYVALIRERKFKEALELIREKIPLPAICGRVCGFCEDQCNRSNVDEPIEIRALKRFAADYEMMHNNSENEENNKSIPIKERVAIIGSGPAGLTAAYDLAKQGYRPVIFEAMPKPGGMLRYGIPGYRLPNDILDYEIDIIKKTGVEIKTNTPFGQELTLENLYDQDFKALFIAGGTQANRPLRIEGENLDGVIPGINFLCDVNSDKPTIKLKGKKVVVIGGGNTAIDAVRSAVRMGAENAFIVYRRTKAQMPVSVEELTAAEEEGIDIHYLLSPMKIIGNGGKVSRIICNKMKLGSPDASGRQSPIPIEGETVSFDVDIVIPALGQVVDYSFLKEAVQNLKIEKNIIKVDPVTLQTNIKDTFAGGDIAGSGGFVVHAIAHGHKVAVSIDRYLRGEDLYEDRSQEPANIAEMPTKLVEKKQSIKSPILKVEERINNFKEIESVFTEDQAVEEANRCLDCGECCSCLQCVKACEAKAIDHDMSDRIIELTVGSILLSAGCELSGLSSSYKLGYGKYADVVTSLQYERIMCASGPYSGHIQRPSDGVEPHRIAFIQCVGSRDSDNNYCSSVCCMYALKEAIMTKEHNENTHCDIFFMDIRAHGKGFDDYYERAKALGISFTRCRPSKVEEIKGGKALLIGYIDEDGIYKTKEFDLIILSNGFQPHPEVSDFANKFGIALDNNKFAVTKPFDPVASSRDGIYVFGTFSEPKDIPGTVMEASSASSCAMTYLSESRGTEVTEFELTPEIDVKGEPPRIGVFVCHCGKNIGGIVDVPSVAEYANKLPHVVFSDDNLYTCSSDTQEIIKEKIKEYNLNRVVVASCTPRTHEPMFQRTIREAGLNPHLFEMANIRDQCSWVHMHEKEAATEKSKALVRMSVAKVNLTVPITSIPLNVTQKALIVGGGIAGMVAALSIADQGFEVFLVEKTERLGGNALKIDRNLYGQDVKKYLNNLIKRIKNHKLINLFMNTTVKKVDGFIGNFVSTIETKNEVQEVKHGVAILATGGEENKPDQYFYGKSGSVKTLLELNESMSNDSFKVPETVVMIQCVGSREPGHMYCSKVCCSAAVKNAIRMKEMNPNSNIFILYRDIRTYGFREKYYGIARDMGINFIRYDLDKKPLVYEKEDKLMVSVYDHILESTIEINSDLLVLSSRINPNPDNEKLSQLFKVPLSSEKFFLEAHVKLKPVEFATDGVYLCGLSHYPKDISESISQAMAASGRASTVLSKETIEAAGKVAYVKETLCSGCGTCVTVCAYNAISIEEDRKVAVVNEAVCKGCGACAATCRGSAINVRGFEDKQILDILKVV